MTVEPGKLVFATLGVFVGLYSCMTVFGAGAVLAASATRDGAFVVESTAPDAESKQPGLLALLVLIRNAALIVMAPVVIQSLALVKTALPSASRR